MNLEQKILKHLLLDEEYTRKTLPFIKGEYFQESSEKLLFDEIQTYVNKYNTMPTKEFGQTPSILNAKPATAANIIKPITLSMLLS